VKPTPLSAMLADDLLLDRVGARLDADDELGSLLLAVARRADTPIPRATRARRVRPHRGLTVLAALGVAVSGATVAAAVELAPMPSDQGSGVPHARAYLPPSLQALVMPFLAGSPFQGRLVMPFGGLPGVPLDGGVTAVGLQVTALPSGALLVEPLSAATAPQEAQLDKQDQQDQQRQKIQAKGTPATGQGETPPPADEQGENQGENQGEDQAAQLVAAAPEPKPTPSPTSTPTPGGATNGANGATNGAIGAAYGQANGAANGQGHGRGVNGTPAGEPTSGTGTGETTTGDTTGDPTASTDDAESLFGAPAKGKGNAKAVTGAPVVAGTAGATPAKTSPAPASTTISSPSTEGSTGP
jgi:hypothetical protein